MVSTFRRYGGKLMEMYGHHKAWMRGDGYMAHVTQDMVPTGWERIGIATHDRSIDAFLKVGECFASFGLV